MIFHGMNYLAVILAALAGMMAGAAWYGALAKPWMKAVGMSEEPKQNPKIYIVALISQFLIAYILAGLIGHIGTYTIFGGVLSALFCWAGFTIAPMMTNHRFHNATSGRILSYFEIKLLVLDFQSTLEWPLSRCLKNVLSFSFYGVSV